MKTFHYSGYSHSDHVEIEVDSNFNVRVLGRNDGYPNPMGAGGYYMPVPRDLIENFNSEKFEEWLKRNFWVDVPIEIVNPAKENEVIEFLSEALKR